MNCDMLWLDPKINTHRVCTLCILEKQIPYKQLKPIPDILDLEPSTSYPFYILKEKLGFADHLESELNIDEICSRLNTFFTKQYEEIEKYLSEQLKAQNQILSVFASKFKE